MEISYTITYSDIWHLSNYMRYRGNRVKQILVYAGLVVMIAACAWFELSLPFFHHNDLFTNLIFLILFLCVVTLPAAFTMAKVRKQYGGRAVETIRLNQEGFIHGVSVQETIVHWRGVTAVGEDKHATYFLVKQELGDFDFSDPAAMRLSHYIVPKRAFRDDGEARTFFETASAFWKEAADDGGQSFTHEPPDVSFTLTMEDMTHYCKYKAQRKKSLQFWGKRLYIGVIAAVYGFLIAVLITFYFWIPGSIRSIIGPAIGLTMIALVSIMIGMTCLALWLRRPQSTSRLWLPPAGKLFHHAGVTIGPDAVSRMTERERRVQSWSTISDIRMDDRLIYFLSREQRGFYVPLQAFASPSMARAYHAKAVRFWKGEGDEHADVQDHASWPPPPRSGGAA